MCVVVGAGSALVGAGGSGGGARRARARGQGPSSWHRTCIRAPLPPGALLPGPPLRSQPGWPLPALPCAAAACWGSVALGRCCQFPCPSPLRFPCYQLHPARTGASRERAARAGACEQPSPSHRSHRHADRAATPQPRSGNSPRYPPGRLQVPRQLHDGIWSPVRRASGALPSIPPPLRSRSRCPSAPPPRPPVVVVSPQYQFHCGAERHRCRARAASHDCTRDLVRDAAQRAARRSRPGRTRAACSRSSRAHARHAPLAGKSSILAGIIAVLGGNPNKGSHVAGGAKASSGLIRDGCDAAMVRLEVANGGLDPFYLDDDSAPNPLEVRARQWGAGAGGGSEGGDRGGRRGLRGGRQGRGVGGRPQSAGGQANRDAHLHSQPPEGGHCSPCEYPPPRWQVTLRLQRTTAQKTTSTYTIGSKTASVRKVRELADFFNFEVMPPSAPPPPHAMQEHA